MFYQRLLDLCSARNLKITNLVPVWGISSGNLSKWKSGGVPRGDTLCKIADYFGVSTDYLLGRTEVRELARTSPLSSSENSLIQAFRSLSPMQQGQVIGYLDGLRDSQPKQTAQDPTGAVRIG